LYWCRFGRDGLCDRPQAPFFGLRLEWQVVIVHHVLFLDRLSNCFLATPSLPFLANFAVFFLFFLFFLQFAFFFLFFHLALFHFLFALFFFHFPLFFFFLFLFALFHLALFFLFHFFILFRLPVAATLVFELGLSVVRLPYPQQFDAHHGEQEPALQLRPPELCSGVGKQPPAPILGGPWRIVIVTIRNRRWIPACFVRRPLSALCATHANGATQRTIHVSILYKWPRC
jgi:hypothetical protein